MLSRTVIFAFSFLGAFALLMAAIPSQFMAHQEVWAASYFHTDEQVAKFFNAHNITVYTSQAQGTLDYPAYVHLTVGLPSGEDICLAWAIPYAGGRPAAKQLWIWHEYTITYLGILRYWTHDWLWYTSKSGVSIGGAIYKDTLVEYFDSTLNGTFFSARCDHGVQVNIIYAGNITGTIGESWDAGHLIYKISYELDASASAINMFTLLGQVLTFQSPNLGVSGWFGTMLNAIIAIPVYATCAYIVWKLITGLTPWLSGGAGD